MYIFNYRRHWAYKHCMTFDFNLGSGIQRKSSLKSITLNAHQMECLQNLGFQSYYFRRSSLPYCTFITHQQKAYQSNNTKKGVIFGCIVPRLRKTRFKSAGQAQNPFTYIPTGLCLLEAAILKKSNPHAHGPFGGQSGPIVAYRVKLTLLTEPLNI